MPKAIVSILNNSLAQMLYTENKGFTLILEQCTGIPISNPWKASKMTFCFFVGLYFSYTDRPRWHLVGTAGREAAWKHAHTGISFWLRSIFHFKTLLFSGMLELHDILWHIIHIQQGSWESTICFWKRTFQKSIRTVNLFWRRQQSNFPSLDPALINQSTNSRLQLSPALGISLIQRP